MPVQTHEINVQGLSGAIFWAILASVIFYVVGFATTGWSLSSNTWSGLWSSCSASSSIYSHYDWFKAVQAMAIIGLVCLVISLIFIFSYMFLHSISVSKSLLLKLIVGFTAVSVISITIALALFGSKKFGQLHWSYGMVVIGVIFCFLSLIFSCVQMKRASII